MENHNSKIKFKTVLYSLPPHSIFYIYAALLTIVISLLSMLIIYINNYTVYIPASGGELKIATANSIRYIDPIFANNNTEIGLSRLVYSGLMRHVNDNYVFDLAENIVPTEDSLGYKVKLKNAKFADGTTITSADIAYTIELLSDSLINSPRHKDWKNITVNIIDDNNLEIRSKTIIDNPRELFTQGIIKKSEWVILPKGSLSLSSLNLHAIGSGPYELSKTEENNKIVNQLDLDINSNYKTIGTMPYIDSIKITIFPNVTAIHDALKNGETYMVENLDPSVIESIKKENNNIKTETYEMPRTFGLFFNPNNDKNLASVEYRQDLRNSINRVALINDVLGGYGKISSAVYNSEYSGPISETATVSNNYNNRNISIYTLNNPDLLKVANMIKSNWQQIGVTADIRQYEYGEFEQDIIKNRNFSVLLFAVDIDDATQVYNLWHSSGRSYPGSNITNYYSTTLDANLEALVKSTDANERLGYYNTINTELDKNVAWAPLYSPFMIYGIDKDLNISKVQLLKSRTDIMDNIIDSYINKEKVYSIFQYDKFYKKLIDIIR